MTIFQKELLRKLPSIGCTCQYDEATGKLKVSLDGHILCSQDDGDYLIGVKDMSEEQKLRCNDVFDLARNIRDYIKQYESSPQIDVPGITNYRKMAEYGQTVLGGIYSENHGFMFSTWQISLDRSSAFWGHYTPDYEAAKQDFATRAGFLDEDTIFTEKEAFLLYACLDYTKNSCESLTYEQDEQIGAMMEKIEDAYPKIEESPPTLEQDDAPQLNM